MHELKTPITKGRFSVEMLEDNKYKTRLLNVFIRMEGLINEMALVEQIASGFEQTNVEEYRAVDIIAEAIDLGFFDSLADLFLFLLIGIFTSCISFKWQLYHGA